jgi:hypothetical protein
MLLGHTQEDDLVEWTKEKDCFYNKSKNAFRDTQMKNTLWLKKGHADGP